MNNKKTWLILAGLAVLIAAFLLLNFRLAYSGTQADNNTVTASSGDTLPDAMQQHEKITLYVTGEGPLADALERTLAAEIRDAGLAEVELVQTLDADYPNPVLVVDSGSPRVLWTPVFGSSSFPVEAWFASDGDATVVDAEILAFDNTEGPGMVTHAKYNITDRSWGILSRPGYYQALADYLARSIVEALVKLYTPKF